MNVDERAALLRLAIGMLLGLGVAAAFGVLGTVLFLLAVLFMIVLHELGHFVTAKAAGMKVTEFFVGFGPRIWSVKKGETEYGVKGLPLGGYCKIPGMTMLEEIEPDDEPRTYRQQSFPRRMAVALGGVVTHFVVALVLLYAGLATTSYRPLEPEFTTVIQEVGPLDGRLSPAMKAGFRAGDRIVAVDGRRTSDWLWIVDYISARPGREIVFAVLRKGETMLLRATPVQTSVEPGVEQPVVGSGKVGIAAAVRTYSPLSAIPKAMQELWLVSSETVGALGSLASPSGLDKYGELLGGRTPSAENQDPRFLSPIGLTRVADTVVDRGLGSVLTLLILINIFVGIFNLVPLLPLDGGHVAIAAYERIRSRKGKRYHADVAKLQPLLVLTLLVLVFLAVSSLYLDIVRPVQL